MLGVIKCFRTQKSAPECNIPRTKRYTKSWACSWLVRSWSTTWFETLSSGRSNKTRISNSCPGSEHWSKSSHSSNHLLPHQELNIFFSPFSKLWNSNTNKTDWKSRICLPIPRLHIVRHTKYDGHHCNQYECNGHHNDGQLWLLFHFERIDWDDFRMVCDLISYLKYNCKWIFGKCKALYGQPWCVHLLPFIIGTRIIAGDILRTVFIVVAIVVRWRAAPWNVQIHSLLAFDPQIAGHKWCR